jgi:hypothetical protein
MINISICIHSWRERALQSRGRPHHDFFLKKGRFGRASREQLQVMQNELFL